MLLLQSADFFFKMKVFKNSDIVILDPDQAPSLIRSKLFAKVVT